jgi:hypothetical protein
MLILLKMRLKISSLIIYLFFQVKIKNKVLFIFEDCMEKGLEDGYFYPEWQFVQYLLQPFVVMLATLAKRFPQKRLLENIFAFVQIFIDACECDKLKERCRYKYDLLVTKRKAKKKLKNLKSLLSQVKREFLLLVGDVKLETESFIRKQLEAFLGVFQWSIEVDLLKDLDDDFLTDAFAKHFGTEFWLQRMLKSLRCAQGLDRERRIGQNFEGYISVFHTSELLLRERLISSCQFESWHVEFFHLFELLDRKLRILLGQHQDFGRLKQNMDKRLIQEAKKLTFPQLLWVAMFHNLFPNLERSSEHGKLRIALSAAIALFFGPASGIRNANSNDGLAYFTMMIRAKKLHRGEKEHPAIVHVETARKFPRVYKFVLSFLQEVGFGKTEDFVAIFTKYWTPIMFCANCFKFDCDLKICKFCEGDFSSSTPTCWFCSEECENEFMDSGHSAAHEEDVIQKLGWI